MINRGIADHPDRPDHHRRDGAELRLSSGLHHAKREVGDGFCTFNGLALAARAAQRAGAGRILVIDLDAHCGGGTHELLAEDQAISQLDVAVNSFDYYQPGRANWTLDWVDRAEDYLPTIRRRLDERSAGGYAYDEAGQSELVELHRLTSLAAVASMDQGRRR